MRVGIITITDGCNYGNRLQNYALQTALESLGAEAETLQRRNFHDAPKRKVKNFCKMTAKKALFRDNDFPKRARKRNFKQFNQEYVTFSKYVLAHNKAPGGLAEHYDKFIVGSDQVWNPRFAIISEDLDNYLASFAPAEKKFSYAASFGTGDIPAEYRARFQKQLGTFSKISVREDKGAELVRQLTGRSAACVCDPTLLIEKEQWQKIAGEPEWLDKSKPYLLTYVLGELDDAVTDGIRQYAEEQKLAVVALQHEAISSRKIADANAFSAPPQEFLWLFEHAQAVVTDSFHACIFAMLFGCPFQVFQRKTREANNNMGSRLESLLGRFGTAERMRQSEIVSALLQKPIDQAQINQVLKTEREKGLAFLRECLES